MKVIAVQKSDRGRYVESVIVKMTAQEWAGVTVNAGEPYEGKAVDISAVYETAKRATGALNSLQSLSSYLGGLERTVATMKAAIEEIAFPKPKPDESEESENG